MEKVRVRELAKELGMKSSKEILLFLERIGEKGKSASSNIDGDMVERVRTHFRKGAPPPPPREAPREVTRADGSLERKSSRVVLRRSAIEPEKPAEPPPPPPRNPGQKGGPPPPPPPFAPTTPPAPAGHAGPPRGGAEAPGRSRGGRAPVPPGPGPEEERETREGEESSLYPPAEGEQARVQDRGGHHRG